MARCGWYNIEGEKVFIPHCYGSLHREDTLHCTCVKPVKKIGIKFSKMEFEPITITINKFDIREAVRDSEYDTVLYNWCKKYKVKHKEPFNEAEQVYDTIIITLDTPAKAMAFQERFIYSLKKLADKINNTP